VALKDLYIIGAESRGRSGGETLWPEILTEHFEAIEQAYIQAGLDFDKPSLQECPGLETDDGSFQVNIAKNPRNGEILGAHSLATTPEEERVNETDIFLWEGQFEQAAGRLRTPESQYLQDYQLTNRDLQKLTAYIRESAEAGQFTVVKDKHLLSLPQ
jgi:hypothetical protein